VDRRNTKTERASVDLAIDQRLTAMAQSQRGVKTQIKVMRDKRRKKKPKKNSNKRVIEKLGDTRQRKRYTEPKSVDLARAGK